MPLPPITPTGFRLGGSADAGGQISCTIPVGAGLVVVNVQSSGTFTITCNGTSMTPAATITAGSYTLAQFYLAVSGGTALIEITGGPFLANAVNVTGLANNAPDKSTTDSGSASTPDTGATGTTSTAREAAIAAFGLQYSSGAWTWAGTPTFSAGASDIQIPAPCVGESPPGPPYVTLTEGNAVLSATGTVEAALSGITPSTWQGLVVTYS